jgi:hypothetical protein
VITSVLLQTFKIQKTKFKGNSANTSAALSGINNDHQFGLFNSQSLNFSSGMNQQSSQSGSITEVKNAAGFFTSHATCVSLLQCFLFLFFFLQTLGRSKASASQCTREETKRSHKRQLSHVTRRNTQH